MRKDVEIGGLGNEYVGTLCIIFETLVNLKLIKLFLKFKIIKWVLVASPSD